ncbi:putative transposase [Francisella tularensis subsp. tularensis]|nr:putative transposase [Francisella tularensis subsp. tularensis]
MEYIEKLKEIAQNLLFYIDEMGCDNKLSILRGWSLIGEPSYGEVLAYQTQRRSIVAGYNYADKKDYSSIRVQLDIPILKFLINGLRNTYAHH